MYLSKKVLSASGTLVIKSITRMKAIVVVVEVQITAARS